MTQGKPPVSLEHRYEADILDEGGRSVEVMVTEKYVKDKDRADIVVMTDEGFVPMRLVSRELSRQPQAERIEVFDAL